MIICAVKPGDSVLVLGTGGVSIFALQFARLAGARVYMTSSSDEKLERGRALGATGLINYKRTPEWDKEVLKLTEGRGVNCVIEVGGPGTLARSMQSVAYAGKIALIGVLAGFQGDTNPHPVMRKGASLHGIFVGNQRHARAHERGDRSQRNEARRRQGVSVRAGARCLPLPAKWRPLRQGRNPHLGFLSEVDALTCQVIPFLGRALAAEDGVAMGEAPEAPNDVAGAARRSGRIPRSSCGLAPGHREQALCTRRHQRSWASISSACSSGR